VTLAYCPRMKWGRSVGALCWILVGALLSACSGDNQVERSSYCAIWEKKQRECGVLGPGRTNCFNQFGAAESCAIECVSSSTCSNVSAQVCPYDPSDALSSCLARCVGQEPVLCQDGTVVSGFRRCNGQRDCPGTDDTDERDCAMTGFKCPSVNRYISYLQLCDGRRDCPDGADEIEFYCKGTFKCLSSGKEEWFGDYWRCNGIIECDDGSDEPADCAPLTCPSG